MLSPEVTNARILLNRGISTIPGPFNSPDDSTNGDPLFNLFVIILAEFSTGNVSLVPSL